MEKTVITSFKGFDSGLACRGYQFEIGKTYTVEGEIKACGNGFHACVNPLDVLSYYPLIGGNGEPSRYAIVSQGGAISKHADDTKIASAEITIKAELTLPAFIKAAVDWMMKTTDAGDAVQQVSTGNYVKQASTGDAVKQASTGYSVQQASTGNYVRQASTGDYVKQASTGNSVQQASTGYYVQQASTGNYVRQASTGNYVRQASTGDAVQQVSTGNYVRQASTGDAVKQASTGYYVRQASTGNYVRHRAKGANSVIVSSGRDAKASGVNGTHIALAEYDADGVCIGFAIGCIGKDGIKPDTWYQAKGGKLVEVAP